MHELKNDSCICRFIDWPGISLLPDHEAQINMNDIFKKSQNKIFV